MFCTTCGNDLTGLKTAKFCNNCGSSISTVDAAAPIEVKNNPGWTSRVPKLRKPLKEFIPKLRKPLRDYISKLSRKQRFAAIGATLAIPSLIVGTFVAIDVYRIDESDKNVTLGELISTEKLQELEKVACPKLEQFMFDADEQTTYTARIKALESVLARSDTRYPPIYARNNSWTSDSVRDVRQAVEDFAKSELQALLSSNSRIVDKVVAPLALRFTTEFSELLVEGCGLTSNYSVSSRLATSYNSTHSRFLTAVDNAPWYPAGYTEATWASGTDKIAYKWVERGYDCYSCYQWDINVISKYGCSSSLYAKVNIEKGGVAIGWTNDTLGSLDAGQVGQMRFQYYGEGYGTLTASLEEFSCY